MAFSYGTDIRFGIGGLPVDIGAGSNGIHVSIGWPGIIFLGPFIYQPPMPRTPPPPETLYQIPIAPTPPPSPTDYLAGSKPPNIPTVALPTPIHVAGTPLGAPKHKFSMSGFLSKLTSRNGPARSNRYVIRLLPPQKLQVSPSFLEHLQFTCDEAVLPEQSLTAYDARIYGSPYKIPFGRTWNEFQLSFICTQGVYDQNTGLTTEGCAERMFFERWMNLMINPLTYDTSYQREYAGSLSISVLSTAHGDFDMGTVFYHFDQVYPIAIASQALSWSATDDILKLSVTFAGMQWEMSDNLTPSWEAPTVQPQRMGATGMPPMNPDQDPTEIPDRYAQRVARFERIFEPPPKPAPITVPGGNTNDLPPIANPVLPIRYQ